jgi:hypothetical protein
MVDRRLSCLARPIIVAVVFLLLANTSLAIELRPETIEAFDKFVASVEMRLDSRLIGQTFLWSDEFPGVRQQLLKGIVVVQPLQGNGIVSLKGGLVQDWRGAVFIPYVSLREVLSIVQDYDHHRDFYKPEIADAKIESHQGDEFVVYMRIVKAKFMLSDVLNTEHAIQFVHVDQKRVYSRSYSKRINEVAAPGQTGEHELPSGHDRGLLWRMNGYWFFEERDDGVYITCESITLTRDIPFGMAALIGPIIHDLPGEALRKSLEQTRRAIAPRTTKLYDRRQDEISRDAPDRLLFTCAPSATSLINFPPSRSGKFAVF